MPQAPDDLRELFGDDCDARSELTEHYTIDRFVIRPKQKTRAITDRESAAIDYLVLEWDYGFEAN